MHASATYALFLACAMLGCSPALDGFESDDLGAPRRGHAPWSPGSSGSIADAGEGTANSGEAGSGTGGGSGGAAALPEGCRAGRFVLEGELTNARDVGGTPLHPDGSVACGAVYRGPPLTLSEKGCAAAAQLGIRTVIDLRTESERLGIPDATCLNAAQVQAPLPVPYGLGPTDYLNDLHETASMAAVFHAFGDPAAYPIYFHCTYGRDRTGIVGALLLSTLGVTRAAILQEYMLSLPNVGAYPDSLNAVLDEVEARGGAEAVLQSFGITEQEISVMRAAAATIP